MQEQIQTYILSIAPTTGKIALIFIAYYVAKKLWSRLVLEYTKRWDSNNNTIATIAIKGGDMTLLILAVVTALGTMGINMSALIAGLGLGGFALGYALKDSVSNLLSGILIMVYKPFNNGDTIEVAKFKGKVIEIDLRYTKLENNETVFLVPNKKMFSDPIAISKS